MNVRKIFEAAGAVYPDSRQGRAAKRRHAFSAEILGAVQAWRMQPTRKELMLVAEEKAKGLRSLKEICEARNVSLSKARQAVKEGV